MVYKVKKKKNAWNSFLKELKSKSLVVKIGSEYYVKNTVPEIFGSDEYISLSTLKRYFNRLDTRSKKAFILQFMRTKKDTDYKSAYFSPYGTAGFGKGPHYSLGLTYGVSKKGKQIGSATVYYKSSKYGKGPGVRMQYRGVYGELSKGISRLGVEEGSIYTEYCKEGGKSKSSAGLKFGPYKFGFGTGVKLIFDKSSAFISAASQLMSKVGSKSKKEKKSFFTSLFQVLFNPVELVKIVFNTLVITPFKKIVNFIDGFRKPHSYKGKRFDPYEYEGYLRKIREAIANENYNTANRLIKSLSTANLDPFQRAKLDLLKDESDFYWSITGLPFTLSFKSKKQIMEKNIKKRMDMHLKGLNESDDNTFLYHYIYLKNKIFPVYRTWEGYLLHKSPTPVKDTSPYYRALSFCKERVSKLSEKLESKIKDIKVNRNVKEICDKMSKYYSEIAILSQISEEPLYKHLMALNMIRYKPEYTEEDILYVSSLQGDIKKVGLYLLNDKIKRDKRLYNILLRFYKKKSAESRKRINKLKSKLKVLSVEIKSKSLNENIPKDLNEKFTKVQSDLLKEESKLQKSKIILDTLESIPKIQP